MKQDTNQTVANGTLELKTGWIAPAALLISIATMLLAIFALNSWVELSGWHHAVQHVLIFVSGATAGGSLITMHKTKKEQ